MIQESNLFPLNACPACNFFPFMKRAKKNMHEGKTHTLPVVYILFYFFFCNMQFKKAEANERQNLYEVHTQSKENQTRLSRA